MSIPFVPGPAPVWVATQGVNGNSPFFLGWSERGVSLDLTPSWLPYHCDLGGQVEMDMSYQGQSATIHLDLVRWNPEALAVLEDYVGATAGGPGSAPGVDVPGEIGSLMVYENLAFGVWVRFPYVVGAAGAYSRHPAGYRFPAVVLERESLPERGSRYARVPLSFRALRSLSMSPSTQNAFGVGKFTLYDNDMSAINGRTPD